MSIGERITDLRKKADLSQGQLSKLLNVSRQAVSKWENDQSSPDTVKLISLAEILGTNLEYLATGKEPEPEKPPIVVNLVKTQDKIVEKIVEKPVIKRVVRIRYYRDPLEFLAVGIVCFLLGLLLGFLL